MMMWMFAVLYLSVCVVGARADTTSDQRLEALEAKFEDITRKLLEQTRKNEKSEARIEALEAVVRKQENTIAELSQRCRNGPASTDEPNVEDNLESGESNRSPAVISWNGIQHQRVAPESLVAFTAVMAGVNEMNIGINQNIVFEKVVLNQGNGYHPQHGVFITPRAGVYLFTANLVHSTTPGSFHGGLMLNGNLVVRLHGMYNIWDSTSQTVLLSLSSGDEVYVRNLDSEHQNVIGSSYSSFSGFLVWEL